MALMKTRLVLAFLLTGCFVVSCLCDSSTGAFRKKEGMDEHGMKTEGMKAVPAEPALKENAMQKTGMPEVAVEEPEDTAGAVPEGKDIEMSLQQVVEVDGSVKSKDVAGDMRQTEDLSSSLAFYSPIPLPAAGSCQAGAQYQITSVQSLFNHAADLDCIFAGGLQPPNVPLGYGYGYVLSAANTGFWSGALQKPYQGDYIVKTQCGGKFYNIGWLSIGGLDLGTAVWTIDDLGWEMAAGEYPEGNQKSILMDFTVDFSKLCAPEGNESPLGLIGFSPFSNSVFPISTFKDMGRVVGIDSDGATILLNKALVHAPGLGAQTVLFYAIKTFDKSVKPVGFERGIPVVVPKGPNGETTISYRRGGVEGIVARIAASILQQ